MKVVHVSEITDPVIADEISDAIMSQSLYLDTWPFMDWLAESANDAETRLFAIKDKVWRGFCAFSMDDVGDGSQNSNEHVLTIKFLYVADESRNQKYASRLMNSLPGPISTDIWKKRFRDKKIGKKTIVYLSADCFSEAVKKLAEKCFSAVVAEFSDETDIQLVQQISMIDTFE